MKKAEKFQGSRGSVAISGGKSGVLLVHSLGGSPLEMKFVANTLAQQGYTVYCPVIPGLTFGTDVSNMSTWRDWYRALETAFEELKAHCDHVIIGGASAGAVLTLRLAAERKDDVHGVVLFAPTLIPNGWAIPKTFHFFRIIRQRAVARLFTLRMRAPFGIKDDRMRTFTLEAMKGDGSVDFTERAGATVYEFLKLVRNVRPMLKRIAHHTLIFHPRQDDQSHLKNAMKLQRDLSGMVEMCILDDSYHMVTLDKQRGLVAERTADFVDRVLKGAVKVQPAQQTQPAATGKHKQGAAE